jgi:hypothetical protein
MGRDFFKISKEEFKHCGLEIGLAKKLADFTKNCKDKKLRLSKVLAKYSYNSDSIDSIPLFFHMNFRMIIRSSNVA